MFVFCLNFQFGLVCQFFLNHEGNCECFRMHLCFVCRFLQNLNVSKIQKWWQFHLKFQELTQFQSHFHFHRLIHNVHDNVHQVLNLLVLFSLLKLGLEISSKMAAFCLKLYLSLVDIFTAKKLMELIDFKRKNSHKTL